MISTDMPCNFVYILSSLYENIRYFMAPTSVCGAFSLTAPLYENNYKSTEMLKRTMKQK